MIYQQNCYAHRSVLVHPLTYFLPLHKNVEALVTPLCATQCDVISLPPSCLFAYNDADKNILYRAAPQQLAYPMHGPFYYIITVPVDHVMSNL